jgi:hypothetical protein
MPGLTVQFGWHICNQNIVPQISCVEGVSGEYCGVVSAWYPHKSGLDWPFNPLWSKMWAAGWKPSKMTPLSFRPPNPEIITVDPQRKCYGLKNFCMTLPCQVLLSSERLGKSHSPIDVANLMEKCIRVNYLCATYRTVYTQMKRSMMQWHSFRPYHFHIGETHPHGWHFKIFSPEKVRILLLIWRKRQNPSWRGQGISKLKILMPLTDFLSNLGYNSVGDIIKRQVEVDNGILCCHMWRQRGVDCLYQSRQVITKCRF